MNHDQFNQLCGSWPSTTHVIQWHNSQVWKVGGKVFAIGGKDKNGNPTFTFKTSVQNFYFLRDSDGYIPAPYFANRGMKWIQQVDSSEHLDDDLTYYLSESYRLVSQSLPKRVQEELGLNVRLVEKG